MKKIIIYTSLILSMLFLSSIVTILYIRADYKYNYYKGQLSLLQKNNKKVDNKVTRYNDIIHISNKYNGEIKEFKNKNKNINASIVIYENKNNVDKVLDKFKKDKTLNKINTVSLNNENLDSDNYEIQINVDFINE